MKIMKKYVINNPTFPFMCVPVNKVSPIFYSLNSACNCLAFPKTWQGLLHTSCSHRFLLKE